MRENTDQKISEYGQFLRSVSHGNSKSEKGFSIDRFILDRQGSSFKEETIVALCHEKDELCRVGVFSICVMRKISGAVLEYFPFSIKSCLVIFIKVS